jgi:hypothetical protein
MSRRFAEPLDGNLQLPKDVVIGQKFGQLAVVSRLSNDSSGRIRLHCKCECGGECLARLSDLRRGHTKSCSCRRKKAIAWRLGKIQLRQLGSLTALGTTEEVPEIRPSTKWVAICKFCKKVVIASSSQLRGGRALCPCLSQTYTSWRNMIQRCTNNNLAQFKDYGGRGIMVCDEWLGSFQQFASDMGRRPDDTTLDRIDPNGNYCPGNCRWGDATLQAQNRRRPLHTSVQNI